jgi:hypothetical protein
MRDMIRAIEANDIHPVVDEKVFTLEQAREAYEYMVSKTGAFSSQSYFNLMVQWAQKHFGKLTIKIN